MAQKNIYLATPVEDDNAVAAIKSVFDFPLLGIPNFDTVEELEASLDPELVGASYRLVTLTVESEVRPYTGKADA